MIHLRVFERQGPIKFSRRACAGGSETVAHHMTDTATLVTCAKCQKTKWFKQAKALLTKGGEP